MYDIKKELKTQTPIDSPRKHRSTNGRKESPSKVMPLGEGRSLEIVNDSSNDAFTYLCTHPAVQPKSDAVAKSPCEESKSTSEQTKSASEESKSTSEPAKTLCEQPKPRSKEKTPKTAPGGEIKTSEKRSKTGSEVLKSRKRTRSSSVKQELDTTSGFDRRARWVLSRVVSDYVIITSSLSRSALDHIRQFTSRYHVLWMQEFPHQAHLVDASCPQPCTTTVEIPEDTGKGKKRRQQAQRYIVVIRDTEGWCKRTVKYLYGLAW